VSFLLTFNTCLIHGWSRWNAAGDGQDALTYRCSSRNRGRKRLVPSGPGRHFTFTPLGDLPGGITSSAAYGVSADGSVVVGSSASATGVTAFAWTQGGGMAALPMLAGGTGATAFAVSANGAVAVGVQRFGLGPAGLRLVQRAGIRPGRSRGRHASKAWRAMFRTTGW
jgi:probable HAF family extracellular repeat protein